MYKEIIKLEDKENKIRDAVIKYQENVLEEDELNIILDFIKKDKSLRIVDKNTFGDKIGKNSQKFYMFFDILASLNSKNKKSNFLRVNKIKGISALLPNKSNNEIIKLELMFEQHYYSAGRDFDTLNWIFGRSLKKTIKEIIGNTIKEKKIDISSDSIIVEPIMEDSKEIFFQIPIKKRGFILMDANEVDFITKKIRYVHAEGALARNSYFFDNNDKNTEYMLKQIKRDGLFLGIEDYQLSKKHIETYFLKALSDFINNKYKGSSLKGLSKLFSNSLYLRQEIEKVIIKFIENQKEIDEDLILKIITVISTRKRLINNLKQSKKFLKKFGNNPTIKLLLMLQ
jgi:hypothetical protein